MENKSHEQQREDEMELAKRDVDLKNGKNPCRFALFIRLPPGIVSYLPQQKRTWSYRGDAFTDHPPKMIRNLVGMIIRRIDQYSIVELYDNSFSKNDELGRRMILKLSIDQGLIEIEKTRLAEYFPFLGDLPIPSWLKQKINDPASAQG